MRPFILNQSFEEGGERAKLGFRGPATSVMLIYVWVLIERWCGMRLGDWAVGGVRCIFEMLIIYLYLRCCELVVVEIFAFFAFL